MTERDAGASGVSLSSSSLPLGDRVETAGRRAVLRLAVGGLVAFHLVAGVGPGVGGVGTDFANYYVPARAVLEGRAIDGFYDRRTFEAELTRAGMTEPGSFIPHPPANALMLVPFAWLPATATKAVWVIVLAAFWAAAYLALRRVVEPGPLVLALVFLVPTASLDNAFRYGQPYPMLLAFAAFALAAWVKGRPFLAGVLLAPLFLLKPYGVPLLAGLVWRRQVRAVAGAVAGVALGGALSVAVLGWPVHEAYLREVLLASLEGRMHDPYPQQWGGLANLFRRLFQAEPDLNPAPLRDWPWLANALARGVPAAVVAMGVLGGSRFGAPRFWACLMAAGLAATPLGVSYHFVMLVLPVAVLVAETADWRRRLSWIALLAFVTSPATHYFSRFSTGWWNLLGYPRLAALLILLGALLWPLHRRDVLVAAGVGLLGFVSTPAPAAEEPWDRVAEAKGYASVEPRACGEHLVWRTMVRGRWFVQDDRGRDTAGAPLVCGPPTEGHRQAEARWRLIEKWTGRSWDVHAVERETGREVYVAGGPANEREPAWTPAGDAVVFTSDRRRGLGSTALYRVPFPARER